MIPKQIKFHYIISTTKIENSIDTNSFIRQIVNKYDKILFKPKSCDSKNNKATMLHVKLIFIKKIKKKNNKII